jgi:outer membrane protein TolC
MQYSLRPDRRSVVIFRCLLLLHFVSWSISLGGCAGYRPILPEQKRVEFRDPVDLPHARIPDISEPPTVSNPQPADSQEWMLSLDDAIRTALENAEVIRVLSGFSATSSGTTIYDPAIANTVIDQGRFDPTLQALNSFNRVERPLGVFDALSPDGAGIFGNRSDSYNLDLDVTKTNITGGTAGFGVNTNPSRIRPGIFPLNPQNRSSLELNYVQPLLEGGGIGPNVAPIVLARIDTERSFFQFKDSVQEMVRGVIEGYWGIVFARTDLWAREQQVQQGQQAYDREFARKNRGFGNFADVSQSRLALANFRANQISAQENLLQREAALRNVLGLPPTDQRRLIPSTPPTNARINFEWSELTRFAEERRPDLIELKLIIEADQQQLIIARNLALPSMNAVALYRWNGLEGTTPVRSRIDAGGNTFTDWTLGVNFSVPLGLRAARAGVRQRELLIARDRANLDQGVHNMIHILAGNIRNLDQFYEQLDVFKETREAAHDNLTQQTAENRSGRVILLNVLQAITAWGNSVSAEAQALAQYNIELANLERQTGTILETHGIRFYEEHWQFAGPCLKKETCYPAEITPSENTPRYPSGDEPAENFFDLKNPIDEMQDRDRNSPNVPPKP